MAELVECADLALAEAKMAGKARWCSAQVTSRSLPVSSS